MSAWRVSNNPSLSKLVEKQMRNWEIARSQSPDKSARQESDEVAPFVTISRWLGAGGRDVAVALGERLGWPVLDKEILDAMAGDDEIRRQVYESMDERDVSWFEDMLGNLWSEGLEKDNYFHRLSETVLSLARQGSAVFLGRGIDFILPRSQGLRVRLVAAKDYCVARYAWRYAMNVDQASKEIERREREIYDFINSHFKMDQNDPVRSDLVINMDRFTLKQATDLIIESMRLRGVSPG